MTRNSIPLSLLPHRDLKRKLENRLFSCCLVVAAGVVVWDGQYQSLMEQFKSVHTSRESLRRSAASVREIQKDIRMMEEEKEQVLQKVAVAKRKVHLMST